MDFPGRLIAVIMAVILILIFPLQYIAQLSCENIDAMVDDRTHRFTDDIRQKGYLDKQMYEEYIGFLDKTSELYAIEMQDIHPVTGEDDSHVHKTGSFMNVSYNEIKTFATHTHTADCYPGDLHICNGTDCKYENEAIAVAAIYLNGIYYSRDGITWTKSNASANSYYDVIYGNGKFVAISENSVYTSKDGINWTQISINFFNVSGNRKKLLKIAYNENGYFYTTGYYEDPSSRYAILKSADGINWEPVIKVNNNSLTDIAISDNTYLFVQENNSGYYRKTTYIINSDGSLSLLFNGPYYNNSINIRQAGKKVFYSENGTSYIDGLAGSLSYVPSVIQYGNGTFLIIHKTNGILKGESFSNLKKLQNHNLTIPNRIYDNMIYFGDKFMFAGYDENKTKIYTSTDGVSWTSADIGNNGSDYYDIQIACNANRGSGEIDRGKCIKKGKYYNKNGNEVQPICDHVVTAITATNPVQTVNEGESIITAANATYLDGHTGIVNCTSNFKSNVIGTQTVTLTYTGLVGNAKTTGTRTCNVTVTVKSAKKLTSIAVTPTSQTIQKYSNASFNVVAYYSDGTSKILDSSQYTVSGLSNTVPGTYNVNISYTENEITKSAAVKVTVTALLRECPICRNMYKLNPDDSDPGCPHCRDVITGIEVSPDYIEIKKGESLTVTVIAIYKDESRKVVNDWTSNFNPERTGLQIVTIEYGGYAKEITVWVNEELIICPVCGTEYPASESSCPVCAEKVIRLSVNPEEITVMQYEPVPLTVSAYYANGESRIVEDWSIDRDTIKPGTFIAVVSYKGVSATVKLNVLSILSIECPICGLIYNISESPKGCPVCSEVLTGIEAYLTTGSNLVQLGTMPSIAIVLIFRDEHREFAYDGYKLEGFDPNEPGIQTVTVKYKEFSTTIILEVVNALDSITCPNGHIYYKNVDGTDPGCPFCHTNEDISKVKYFDITYTSDILNEVYSRGVYHFQKGNYITVMVVKKNKSLLYKMQKTFFGTSLLGSKKRFVYGGNIY